MKVWEYAPLAAVAGFLALGLATPMPHGEGSPDLIKLASSLPRTGSAKGQTDAIVNGIRLALDEAGYRVELGGRAYRIEYLDLDDATAAAGQWTAEQETANANLAVRDPDVMIYIGTYNSGAAKISMPILNRARMLMLSPANTSPSLTKPNIGERDEPRRYRPTGEPNFCRVVPTDDLQGPAGAEWAKELGARRVYVLDDNEVYGKGIADLFEAHARKIGLTILGRESIDAKAQEFKALMFKIRGMNPDLVYFGGTTESKGGQVAKDMVAAGMRHVRFMAPDGCYQRAMIESAGADNLNDRFFVTFGGRTPDKLAETPNGQRFVESYRRLYGRDPDESYAFYGYEAGRVALDALRRAGAKDRDAIRRAGLATRDFDGVAGRWSFDENGDTTLLEMSGIVLRDGKFEYAKKLVVGTTK
jgi:branched-chain amino acid transport system substrate-binding protein